MCGAGMIREELKLSKSRLPEARVESAWAALDKDKSGFINVTEYGEFMQRAMPEGGWPKKKTWKERHAERRGERALTTPRLPRARAGSPLT